MCPGEIARDHNIKLNATINVHPNCRHKIFTMRARHVKQFKNDILLQNYRIFPLNAYSIYFTVFGLNW